MVLAKLCVLGNLECGLGNLDPVSTRKNGTVPFGTVLFGTELFHASSINAKKFQVVPEVITMEEENVLNHKNPVFFDFWRVK